MYLPLRMKGKSSRQPTVPDFSGLREELKRLLEAGAQDSLVELVLGLLEKMAEDNRRLAFRLQAALRQAWRKKSERLSPEQLALFLSEVASQESTQGEGNSGEGQPPSAPLREESSAPEASAAEVEGPMLGPFKTEEEMAEAACDRMTSQPGASNGAYGFEYCALHYYVEEDDAFFLSYLSDGSGIANS